MMIAARNLTHLTALFLPLALACSDTSAKEGPSSSDLDSKAAAVKAEMSEAWRALRDYTFAQRDELSADLEKGLAELEVRISQWKVRAEEGAADVQQDADEVLAELKEERAALAECIEDLGEASKEGWQQVRDDAVDALESLELRLKRSTDS